MEEDIEEDIGPKVCIVCAGMIEEGDICGVKAELAYGSITGFYHQACFEGRTGEDHIGDLYRMAANFMVSVDGHFATPNSGPYLGVSTTKLTA